nr:hypothetical protein [Tanacetum cinerariifolium]
MLDYRIQRLSKGSSEGSGIIPEVLDDPKDNSSSSSSLFSRSDDEVQDVSSNEENKVDAEVAEKQWEHITGSGKTALELGMDWTFNSQQSSPKLDAASAINKGSHCYFDVIGVLVDQTVIEKPEIRIPVLECNVTHPEGVPFVNNMVIEEHEYGMFFTDVFGDEAFQRCTEINKVGVDTLITYLVMASNIKTHENERFCQKLKELIAKHPDQEKLK